MSNGIGDKSLLTLDEIVAENMRRGLTLTHHDVLLECVDDPRLNLRHRRVLKAIMRHTNQQTGIACPGWQRLSDDTAIICGGIYDPESQYTVRGVGKTIAELIGFGYLVTDRRLPTEGGKRALAHYAVVRPTQDYYQAEITAWIMKMRGKTKPSEIEIQQQLDLPSPADVPHISVAKPSSTAATGTRDRSPVGVVTRPPERIDHTPVGALIERLDRTPGGDITTGGDVTPGGAVTGNDTPGGAVTPPSDCTPGGSLHPRCGDSDDDDDSKMGYSYSKNIQQEESSSSSRISEAAREDIPGWRETIIGKIQAWHRFSRAQAELRLARFEHLGGDVVMEALVKTEAAMRITPVSSPVAYLGRTADGAHEQCAVPHDRWQAHGAQS